MNLTAPNPSLFHVTHPKAGSTWIVQVLQDTFLSRVTRRIGHFFDRYQWQQGAVYPAVVATYDEYQAFEKPGPHRAFYVMRDPRDTMVSLYFSMKYSHTTEGFPHIAEFRKLTENMTEAEGMLHVFDTRMKRLAEFQQSWLDSGERVLRYEDLITENAAQLPGLFDELGIEYERERLFKALERRSFEKTFKRPLGERDEQSHGRQGLPGDWKNYVTPEIEPIIERRFGAVLQQAGYNTE